MGDLNTLTIYGVGDVWESVVKGKWEGYEKDYHNILIKKECVKFTHCNCNGGLDYERPIVER